MTDIAIAWDQAKSRGDWTVTSSDLVTGADIESAVLLSLFTDRVAPDDMLAAGGPGVLPDRHGWWGDTYEIANGNGPWGSLLWTLTRAKVTGWPQLALKVKGACVDALQWLIDIGAAAAIDVTVSRIAAQAIGIRVAVTRPAAAAPQIFDYSVAWNGL